MKKKISLILGLLFIFLGGYVINADQDNLLIDPNLIKEAEKGLESFKEVIIDDYEGYGYDSKKDLQNATISQGFQIYFLDYDKLQEKEVNSFRKIVTPTNEWEFIVTNRGKAESFLRVVDMGDEYESISFGGDARNFNGILNRIKQNNLIDPIIIQQNFNSYFLVYTNQKGKEIVIPIQQQLKEKEISSVIKEIKQDIKEAQKKSENGYTN